LGVNLLFLKGGIYEIIKPDWNKFKAKFSDNPQKNFEWLCYSLFCREFNKPMGIARYINQSGIETFPITKDNAVIGWQAKFYETPLSQHKVVLLETIIKAKEIIRKFPKLFFIQILNGGKAEEITTHKLKLKLKH
jgi:hypothetical protein